MKLLLWSESITDAHQFCGIVHVNSRIGQECLPSAAAARLFVGSSKELLCCVHKTKRSASSTFQHIGMPRAQMFKVGSFCTACVDWRRRPVVDKTCDCGHDTGTAQLFLCANK